MKVNFTYYLFPDIYGDAETAALREEIQNQFPVDLRPLVHFGNPIRAGELDGRLTAVISRAIKRLVAEPRANALREALVQAENNLYNFEETWSEKRPPNAETCTVCGVRPVGYPLHGAVPEIECELADWATQEKAQQRNVCRICLNRRGRRSQRWASGDLRDTIWVDEVADNNGRLALFVGKLGLEDWLDGTLLNTIKVTPNTTKTPSPARLYRIAETARSFWQTVVDKKTQGIVGQRSRLALYPNIDSLSELGDYHVYELDVDGLPLNVVWDKPKGRFITAENLTYFACRRNSRDNCEDKLVECLQGRRFSILESSGFQKARRLLTDVRIDRVERLGGYLPYIPMLAEPVVCLMLVPADKALALAKEVKSEYERQMGRVRDRLPLSLGLVFFPRRTPMRAILEAGRAILHMGDNALGDDRDQPWEGWRLVTNDNSSASHCELTFKNGIVWRIPLCAGDRNTTDTWYPHLRQGFRQQDARPTHVRDLQIEPPNGRPNSLWRVWVLPSHFDFEFLDIVGRRFDIYYDQNGRRPRHTRPFYLEDIDRLSEIWDKMRHLASAQLRQVIYTIEATRELWYGRDADVQAEGDDVFRQLVSDILATAAWPENDKWADFDAACRDEIIAAGVKGELADLAELHMEILKE